MRRAQNKGEEAPFSSATACLRLPPHCQKARTSGPGCRAKSFGEQLLLAARGDSSGERWRFSPRLLLGASSGGRWPKPRAQAAARLVQRAWAKGRAAAAAAAAAQTCLASAAERPGCCCSDSSGEPWARGQRPGCRCWRARRRRFAQARGLLSGGRWPKRLRVCCSDPSGEHTGQSAGAAARTRLARAAVPQSLVWRA